MSGGPIKDDANLLICRDEHVATLILNRSSREDALSLSFLAEFGTIISHILDDGTAEAVDVPGEGDGRYANAAAAETTADAAPSAHYLTDADLVASRLGPLDRLVDSTDRKDETPSWANRIFTGLPIAHCQATMMPCRGLEMDSFTTLQMAAATESITLSSADHNKGLVVAREHRRPEYGGI